MSIKNRAAKTKRHRRVCQSKHRHASRAAAVHAMQLLARQSGASLRRMEVYRCLACHQWHYGHSM